uniref:AT28810p n=1 Tax=Drosophila melanogaster TaxID=7227 RepID=Q8T3V8_DROME|nr:AT28810p [Drosophila melanogaster]
MICQSEIGPELCAKSGREHCGQIGQLANEDFCQPNNQVEIYNCQLNETPLVWQSCRITTKRTSKQILLQILRPRFFNALQVPKAEVNLRFTSSSKEAKNSRSTFTLRLPFLFPFTSQVQFPLSSSAMCSKTNARSPETKDMHSGKSAQLVVPFLMKYGSFSNDFVSFLWRIPERQIPHFPVRVPTFYYIFPSPATKTLWPVLWNA